MVIDPTTTVPARRPVTSAELRLSDDLDRLVRRASDHGQGKASTDEVMTARALALASARAVADEAAERGRAEALAEVDAACARIVKDKHGVGVDGMVALYGFQRGDDGPTEWGEARCEVGEPTPTAALFVAAAAATASALTPGGAS